MSDREAHALESCPFCGRTVDVVTTKNSLCMNGTHTIECCSEMSEGFIIGKRSERAALSRLLKKWNKRAAQ